MDDKSNNPNANGSDNGQGADKGTDISGLLGGRKLDLPGLSEQGGSNGNSEPDKQDDQSQNDNGSQNDGKQGQNGDQNQDGKQGEQGKQGGEAKQATAVEVDNVEYKLDDKGNALNADGTVFMTKEKLDELAANNAAPATTAHEDLFKMAGIIPLGEDGKPKKYEDSLEGLMQASVDVGEIKAKAAFNEELDAVPGMRKYYEYLKRGGNPTEYHKQVASSWKAVKFDAKNVDMATNAVVANLRKTGMSEENAKITAKLYADTNQLEQMGKDAYTALTKAEDEREAIERQNHEQGIKAEMENEEKYWKSVDATIKQGKLDKIIIPETDRASFFKYLSAPVDKERNSQSIIDNGKLPLERLLELEYLKYKNFDLSTLITAAAETKRVNGLKGRFSTKKADIGGGQGPDKSQYERSAGLDGIKLSNLKQS